MSEVIALAMENAVPQEGPAYLSVPEQGGKWVFLSLWLFTVAVYARPEDIFSPLGDLHLTFIFGCCAGLAYLGTVLSGRMGFLWTQELKITLLLTAWYVVGIPLAFWRGGSFQVFTHVWLKTLFIFFLLTQTLFTMKRIRALLWAIILSELAVTGFSIIQSSKVTWVGERMLGFNQGILGWNFLGIAVAVTLPYLAAILVLTRSAFKSVLLVTASLSMIWMLMLTASRGGVLNVVFSVAVTWIFVLCGSVRGRIIGAGIILAMVLAVCLAPNILWQRLGTIWGEPDIYAGQVAASAEESKEDHLSVLVRSIQYTFDHPIFGLGLGNFQVASGTELGQPSAWMGTHNTFTEISSEAGIPAVLLFLGLIVTATRNVGKVSAWLGPGHEGIELQLIAKATKASLLSFAFGAFFAHLAYEYYFFYPLAVAVGVQHVAERYSPLTRRTRPIQLSSSHLPQAG
jgi:O-antigen ligase